ncbi:MAG: protocatechuate 3,4-dioxygenase subunit alpha [Emcibacteraceae bacterium]|nr:protocatechuate 3,4-dioxygenase subunit alpha [Emcibacteraceae bacterium]
MPHSDRKINQLKLTNEDTLGPYYPISLCDNDNMNMIKIHSGIVHKATGEKIIIKGCIKDKNGSLAHGCLLEFWQANEHGIYRSPDEENNDKIDPWFTGYARHRTMDGNFKLTTIKPGVNNDLDMPRAPNITLTIFSDGIMRLVTQLFFDGEESNETDPLLLSIPKEMRKRLLLKAMTRADDGTTIYNIEINMSGENETPFFDDLLS